MPITSISWATHSLNPTLDCTRPIAVPPYALPIMAALEIPVDERWTMPNSSPECAKCYAEEHRCHRLLKSLPYKAENAAINVKFRPEVLREFVNTPVKPIHLPPSQRQRFFICSYSDIFHEAVPDAYLEKLWDAMLASEHIYMLLTKRPERAAEWPGPWLGNIWLGTSCGHEITKWRIEYLRRSQAKVRFVSMEPLLMPMLPLNLKGIHQVIVGGESGAGHSRMNMQWARDVRQTCAAQGCAFFYKQDADFFPGRRPYLVEEDGTCWQYHQYPGELSAPVQVKPDKKHKELFAILQ